MNNNRERLYNYLRGVATVFNENGPKISRMEKLNNFTTVDVTDQYINTTITNLLNTFDDNQIDNALNKTLRLGYISDELRDIVDLLIYKITGNIREPLWSEPLWTIQTETYGKKQYLVPSDEAIEKYDLQSKKGKDGSFLNSNFEIQPLQPLQPKKSIFDIFKGGKKSKRRRRIKSRAKQRVKKSTCKKRCKK
jgi:hypothetical protein